jgi:hypothetical protein
MASLFLALRIEHGLYGSLSGTIKLSFKTFENKSTKGEQLYFTLYSKIMYKTKFTDGTLISHTHILPTQPFEDLCFGLFSYDVAYDLYSE